MEVDFRHPRHYHQQSHNGSTFFTRDSKEDSFVVVFPTHLCCCCCSSISGVTSKKNEPARGRCYSTVVFPTISYRSIPVLSPAANPHPEECCWRAEYHHAHVGACAVNSGRSDAATFLNTGSTMRVGWLMLPFFAQALKMRDGERTCSQHMLCPSKADKSVWHAHKSCSCWTRVDVVHPRGLAERETEESRGGLSLSR